MNIIPPPLSPNVDMQVRVLYSLSFAVTSSILSKWELFGPISWLLFGMSLQWVWGNLPIVVESTAQQSRRQKSPVGKKKKRKKSNIGQTKVTSLTKLPSRRVENASQYPKYEIVLDYTFEQVVEAFFNKYKDPLPDPDFPEILSITIDKEETMPNGLIFKRRTFTIKNEEDMPYVLRKLLTADTVVFEENCIIDMENKTLEMATHNKSFSSLGQMLDLQSLNVDPNDPNKTIFVETGEVSMFGVPWMLRSKAEGLVVAGFVEKFEESITFFKQRLQNLFGPPPQVPGRDTKLGEVKEEKQEEFAKR